MQDASERVEDSGWRHCEVHLCHLWKAVLIMGCPQWLEKGRLYIHPQQKVGRCKIISFFQKEGPWSSCLTSVPVNVMEQVFTEAISSIWRTQGDWKQPTWIYERQRRKSQTFRRWGGAHFCCAKTLDIIATEIWLMEKNIHNESG